MIFGRFHVPVVDFPFSDVEMSKRQPALILSDAQFIGQTGRNALVCMITSARHSSWPGDCDISDLDSAGLPNPSKARMRFWTIARDRLEGPVGRIPAHDQLAVRAALAATLAL